MSYRIHTVNTAKATPSAAHGLSSLQAINQRIRRLEPRPAQSCLLAGLLMEEGIALPDDKGELCLLLDIEASQQRRRYWLQHAQAIELAREKHNLLAKNASSPGKPESPAQQGEAPSEPAPASAPQYAGAGFIKPSVNLSIRPGDEKKVIPSKPGWAAQVWGLFLQAKRRHGVALFGTLDKPGNLRFQAIKGRLHTLCGGALDRAAAFVDAIVAQAKAAGHAASMARLLAHWSELEGAAKAALGVAQRPAEAAAPAGWRKGWQRKASAAQPAAERQASHDWRRSEAILSGALPKAVTATAAQQLQAMRAITGAAAPRLARG